MGGSGNSSPAKKGFSQTQSEAIDHYVSGNGMYINQLLRQDAKLTDNEKELVKDLDSALNKNVTDSVLYRSVDASVIFDNVDFYNLESALKYGASNKYEKEAMQKAQASIGKTITEKGYMSTTRDASIAENFGDFTGATNPIVMKITTGKNTKGANVSKASKGIVEAEKFDPQKETLLARNQKYEVKKMYVKNGQVYVDVKMK